LTAEKSTWRAKRNMSFCQKSRSLDIAPLIKLSRLFALGQFKTPLRTGRYLDISYFCTYNFSKKGVPKVEDFQISRVAGKM